MNTLVLVCTCFIPLPLPTTSPSSLDHHFGSRSVVGWVDSSGEQKGPLRGYRGVIRTDYSCKCISCYTDTMHGHTWLHINGYTLVTSFQQSGIIVLLLRITAVAELTYQLIRTVPTLVMRGSGTTGFLCMWHIRAYISQPVLHLATSLPVCKHIPLSGPQGKSLTVPTLCSGV